MSETNPGAERVHLPVASPPANHGHTTAAWVTVITVLVGSTLAAVAMVFAAVPLVWVGAVIVVLGLVAGRVLKMLGLGQPLEQPRRTAHSGD
ncbi:HGxxPAAW family protein [Actinotalea sp.]|uniref:HGxxPAAW family protein n=1 Tax=Actinotalea sp. TaxID=1872145 RepID=UPI003567E77E